MELIPGDAEILVNQNTEIHVSAQGVSHLW